MALRYLIVDDATGKKSRGSAVGTSAVDQSFDVGVGGQAQFTVSQAFTAQSKIDVFVNGVLKREGASYDYQRTLPQNRIDFTFTVPQFSWVMIRVFV